MQTECTNKCHNHLSLLFHLHKPLNSHIPARRKWKKFGQAAIDEDQSNVTIQSRDDIYMEDPNADVDLQEEDVGKAIAGNLNAFWAKQNMRNLQRKYDVDGDDAGKGDGGADDGWTQVGAGGGGGGGGGGGSGNKYVPPSARGGGGGMGGKSLAGKLLYILCIRCVRIFQFFLFILNIILL